MQVSLYSASTEAELQAMYANGATSWCASLGWLALFNSGRRQCDITINPYGQTTVAVVPQDGHFGGAAAFECSTQERSELSVQLIATGIVGVVLVIFAPYLATSLAFRISVGGFVSVLLFSLLAALFLMRCGAPPHCFGHADVRSTAQRTLQCICFSAGPFLNRAFADSASWHRRRILLPLLDALRQPRLRKPCTPARRGSSLP